MFYRTASESPQFSVSLLRLKPLTSSKNENKNHKQTKKPRLISPPFAAAQLLFAANCVSRQWLGGTVTAALKSSQKQPGAWAMIGKGWVEAVSRKKGKQREQGTHTLVSYTSSQQHDISFL